MKQHRKKPTNIHPHYWLIPTKRNHFHPAILRPVGLVIVALVIAFIPFAYNITSTGKAQVLGYATNISVSGLHSASNQQRANAGLGGFNLNGTLSNAAYNKALDMFADNYWAHTAPDGKQPWTFISEAGYAYSTAGENLAKNFSTSDGVVNGWMNSSGHRANILNTSFIDVGYAAVNGTLLGEETTLVVAMYAAPKAAPAPAPAPAPTPAPAPAATKPTTKATSPSTPTASSPETPVEQPAAEAPAAPAAPTSTEEPEKNNATKPADTQSETESTAASTNPVKGAVEGASIVAVPVKAYQSLNWGQKTSIFILTVVLLLFIMKHTVIWRETKKGARNIWLRAHPLAQGAVLVAAIVLTVTAGTGSIL